MICTHNCNSYIPMPWTAAQPMPLSNCLIYQPFTTHNEDLRTKKQRKRKSVQLRGIPFFFFAFPFSLLLSARLSAFDQCVLLAEAAAGVINGTLRKICEKGEKGKDLLFSFPFPLTLPFCTKLCVTRNHGEKQVTLQPALWGRYVMVVSGVWVS